MEHLNRTYDGVGLCQFWIERQCLLDRFPRRTPAILLRQEAANTRLHAVSVSQTHPGAGEFKFWLYGLTVVFHRYLGVLFIRPVRNVPRRKEELKGLGI